MVGIFSWVRFEVSLFLSSKTVIIFANLISYSSTIQQKKNPISCSLNLPRCSGKCSRWVTVEKWLLSFSRHNAYWLHFVSCQLCFLQIKVKWKTDKFIILHCEIFSGFPGFKLLPLWLCEQLQLQISQSSVAPVYRWGRASLSQTEYAVCTT